MYVCICVIAPVCMPSLLVCIACLIRKLILSVYGPLILWGSSGVNRAALTLPNSLSLSVAWEKLF